MIIIHESMVYYSRLLPIIGLSDTQADADVIKLQLRAW